MWEGSILQCSTTITPSLYDCIVFHLKTLKKSLICKQKIYAKPKSTFNTVRVKEERERGEGHSFPYEIQIPHVFFPMRKRSGPDEGINSFTLVTSLAVMMMMMHVCWCQLQTLENLCEHEENCRSSTLKSSSFVSSSSVSRWWYLSERAGNDDRFRFRMFLFLMHSVYYRLKRRCYEVT